MSVLLRHLRPCLPDQTSCRNFPDCPQPATEERAPPLNILQSRRAECLLYPLQASMILKHGSSFILKRRFRSQKRFLTERKLTQASWPRPKRLNHHLHLLLSLLLDPHRDEHRWSGAGASMMDVVWMWDICIWTEYLSL